MTPPSVARIAFACAFLAALAALAAADTPLDAFRARRAADSLWARQEYEAAARLYARVFAAHPGDGYAQLRAGAGLQAIGRDADAVPALAAAHARGFGNEMRVAYGLAQAAARAGRADDAFRWLDRALAARWEDRADIAADSAFTSLHDDPRWAGVVGRTAAATAAGDDRVAGWRADLAYVLAESRRLHASPARPAFDPAFAAALDALAARVPALDDAAVAIGLQSILATHLADGHTTIYPVTTERVAFPALPLGFWFFPDGLYVVSAGPPHQSLVGKRVVAIGGESTDVLPGALAPYVSRDNEQGLLAMGTLHLPLLAELRALGFTDRLDRATLTVLDGTKRRDVVVAVPAAGGHGGAPRGLPPAPGTTPPAALTRIHEAYWHEDRPDLDALYVQFNRVQNAEGGPSIAAYARLLREALEASGRRNLVFDLRFNHGGNNTLLAPLVRLAAWHETEGGGRRTWALTSRATFSACQNFVNHLERLTATTFVGEETSSKPNFTGEDTGVVLPWSGLRLSISSRWWQDGSPHDRRPYVPVALRIVPTVEDWRAGREPVMAGLAEAIGAP
jgi:hypothetical protein